MSERIRIFMGENSKEKFVNSKSANYLSEEGFRDFPRKTYKRYICLGKEIYPIEQEEITEFYWEDYERFAFESESSY